MTELRWAGIAGILFVVLLIAGVLVSGDVPTDDDPDEDFVEFYEDSGNQTELVCSAYLLVLAGLAFVAFASLGLNGPVLRSGNGAAQTLGRMGMAASIMGAVAMAAGGIALASVAAGMRFGDAPLDIGVARFLPSVAYGLFLVLGGLSFAAAIACHSLASFKAGTLPNWAIWLGYLAAVVLLFGVIFLPMVALPIWVLIVSVLRLMEGREARSMVPAAS
jgi:hypothetical protein